MSFLTLAKEWEYKWIPNILNGIDRSRPANIIEDGALETADNIRMKDDITKVDLGYVTFGDAVRGIPRMDFQFFFRDGTSELLLITDATIYKYASSEWQYISNGSTEPLVNNEASSDTVMEVVSTTGFSAGDYIAVTLDDGTQHQTTIASLIANTSITLTVGLPSAASSGNLIINSVVLAGDSSLQISYVVIPSADYFIFSNGVDEVQRYDGTSCIDLPGLTSFAGFTCQTINLFNDYVVFGHTSEGGTEYPQRIRWSDTGAPTTYVGGNAGYQDLFDSEDKIRAALPLGPYIIFYRNKSIVRCSWLGATGSLFKFETVVTGKGAMSQGAVVDKGDSHLFVGNDNIHEYKGGFDYEDVGDNIKNMIFGTSGDMSPSLQSRVFGIFVDELDEIWFFYPTTNSTTYADKVIKYSIKNGSWRFRSLTDNISGIGVYQSSSDKAWTDLVGDWTQQDWNWNSRSVLSASSNIHLCGTGLQVYSYDYVASDDNGSAISYSLVTKDFGHPRYKFRYDLFDFTLVGSSVLVEYSVDKGETWDALKTFTNNHLTRVFTNKQFISQYMRLRFSGSSSFQLQDFGFMYRIESEI